MTNLERKVRASKRIFIIGNGGSYANAVHICNDLLGVGKPAFTLDPATLTAAANDWGYAKVFSRWIDVVGERGDLLLALSGSGRSRNVQEALRVAAKKGLRTHLFTDFHESLDMQASEEAQLLAGHSLMRSLRAKRK